MSDPTAQLLSVFQPIARPNLATGRLSTRLLTREDAQRVAPGTEKPLQPGRGSEAVVTTKTGRSRCSKKRVPRTRQAR